MATTNKPETTPVTSLGRLLTIGVGTIMAASAINTLTATLGTTAAANENNKTLVEQQPLTIRASIPPNIVLMLDDSGSMNWDIMPDYDTKHYQSKEDFINSSVNGLYYNPDVTYDPPPKVDGTSYPAATFDEAWVNGFDPDSETVDLSIYRGKFDTYNVDYSGTPVQYSISVAEEGSSAYAPENSKCPGDTKPSGTYEGYCYYDNGAGHAPPDDRYDFFAKSSNRFWFYFSRCNETQDVYDGKKDLCTPGLSFFTYIKTTPEGSETRHYVAKNEDDCAAAGLSGDVCEASDAARQNVANWFSYYHTRILMAKSGLFNAFNDLNPKYRVGFGSINNFGASYIKDLDHAVKNSLAIAHVTKFGQPEISDENDPDYGVGRKHFWQWMTHLEPPHKDTPLRKALQAVGKYYKTKQPWTDDGETLACRQSYAILTTDGFWNGSSPGVGNFDGNSHKITDQDGRDFTYNPKPPFSDDYSNTLADVAMKYWLTDLMPDIDNEVPINDADPAFWQHMVTFTIGMGFEPVGIKPEGTPLDDIFKYANGTQKIDGFKWPKPASDSSNNIADMVHAAVNGHGGFYSANDPQSFANGLKNALNRVSERTGSGASLAANATQLDTGTRIYQGIYHTAQWTGNLKSLRVDSNSGKPNSIPEWAASVPKAKDRNIHTYNGDSDAYTEFKSSSDLSSSENNALGSLGDAADMIKYLRGDNAINSEWRQRKTPLGDIVNSQPVYAGAVEPNDMTARSIGGDDSYADYIAENENRSGQLYVAANDGMLHAFSAATGEETYAYLPAAVITHGATDGRGISELADPRYGTDDLPHQYFNDGQLTVANAYFGSAWHTVLVGTTGRGAARVVYALDVTNPDEIKFLWERSAGDGKDNSHYIGQMTGKPIIAQVSGGEWVALLGNGYNSQEGVAALLQFNLTDGTLSVHETSSVNGKGLSTPAVWIGEPHKNISTEAYAGDLEGHVWGFKLDSAGSRGELLFTAKGGGERQPITSGLLMGRNPTTGDKWVFFGTGRYLSADDITNTEVQSWYGLIVQRNGKSDFVTTASREDLAPRFIMAEDKDSNPSTRAFTRSDDPEHVGIDASKTGWYIDLANDPGERMVSPNQFKGNLLISNSIVPHSNDACNPSGTGWVMALDPFTGTNPRSGFFLSNGQDPVTITVDGEEVPAGGIATRAQPNAPTFVGDTMLTGLEDATIQDNETTGADANLGRVSWRELVNP